MANHRDKHGNLLASHFIDYDYRNPSPHFTKQQIDYIESIRDDFDAEDMAWIRNFEWFRLNLNTPRLTPDSAIMFEGAIPGLRQKPGTDCLYVKRYSNQPYDKMIDSFLDHVPEDFPPGDVDKCYMPLYRVIIPNGDRYYPYVFHGDLGHWRKRLLEAAEVHHTLIGGFAQGKFVLSNGQQFDFSALKIDRVGNRDYLSDW